VGGGVEVGAAVLVHDHEVGLVGGGAAGLARRPVDLGEPVPVVVGEGHVPRPRPGQPLGDGQGEVNYTRGGERALVHRAPL
jgi:hypothetical protein